MSSPAKTPDARGPRFLTGPQVDQRFGISRTTRRRWLASGLMPQPVKFSGSPRWDVAELELFEERARQDRGTPKAG